jgi:hypothetical protein
MLKNRTGFLFAFLRFDRLEHPTLIQRAVRIAVRSDKVHVAMLPVIHYQSSPVPRIWVHGDVYTAFISHGACVQEAEHVLDDPSYDYVFLPVPDAQRFLGGIEFLEHMKTAHYNYATLAFALLPYAFKSKHMPDWLTGEDSLRINVDNNEPPPPIFCSQLGMLLCYECFALDHTLCDPALCLPADLEEALLHHAQGFRCAREFIRTIKHHHA